MPKPYEKYVLNNGLAVAAIYELHPFRNVAIKEAVENSGRDYGDNNTGIEDNAWCWVLYDWIGNPISVGSEIPDELEPRKVDKFTIEHGFASQEIADYLNEDAECVWSEV